MKTGLARETASLPWRQAIQATLSALILLLPLALGPATARPAPPPAGYLLYPQSGICGDLNTPNPAAFKVKRRVRVTEDAIMPASAAEVPGLDRAAQDVR